jgi:hypothetical protein
MARASRFLLALSVSALASCVAPPPPMTAAERAESARRLHEIEDENFHYRDRERRSAADAARIANTGAPPVHYHQHRTYAPSYGW